MVRSLFNCTPRSYYTLRESVNDLLVNKKTVPDTYGSTDRSTTDGERIPDDRSLTCSTADDTKDIPRLSSSAGGCTAGDGENKFKRPTWFVLLAIIVVSIYVTKGVLIISKYVHPLLCENATTIVEGDDSLLQRNARVTSYYFTVVVYAIVAVL